MEVKLRRNKSYRGPGQTIRDRRSWAPDEVRVGQLGPSADRAELGIAGRNNQRDAAK